MRRVDDELIAALTTLLRKDAPRHKHVLLRAWSVLQRDVALAAFFQSVEDAGSSAWEEERMRVGRRFVQRTRDLPAELRQGMSRRGAVRSLLPLWRSWGWLLVERSMTPTANHQNAMAPP